jgi:beta-lactamase class D
MNRNCNYKFVIINLLISEKMNFCVVVHDVHIQQLTSVHIQQLSTFNSLHSTVECPHSTVEVFTVTVSSYQNVTYDKTHESFKGWQKPTLIFTISKKSQTKQLSNVDTVECGHCWML